MRISVSVQREIVRLIRQGLSNNRIALILKISPTTVRTYRVHLAGLSCSPDELIATEDARFSILLGTRLQRYATQKLIPDWFTIQQELTKKNVSKALLWEEYLLSLSAEPERALSYSQFLRRYNDWLKSRRMSMRQFFQPAEKMFVDFCGHTMPVINPESGEVIKAQIFVAVLGASSYTFACAVPSQKTEQWIKCHSEAFVFFGGVPEEVVPDNLKAAVIKHTRDEIVTNQAYEECAEYYGFRIMPARSRRPKDKSLAEIGVQIVQRWVLAPLRNRSFFSIDELNAAISAGIEKLNAKESKTYQASRLARFNDIEKQALAPLPQQPYTQSEWQYHIRVPDDYHVVWQKSHYSVPYRYRFSVVDIKITDNTLEVLLNRVRIALHQCLKKPGKSTHPEHMPDEHRYQAEQEPGELLLWAESIGPSVRLWVQMNLEQRRHYASGLKSVRRLKKWVREEQNHKRTESGCEFALRFNILSFEQLKRIIKNKSDLMPQRESTSWVKQHGNLRGADYYKS